jgi:hypothetical protein
VNTVSRQAAAKLEAMAGGNIAFVGLPANAALVSDARAMELALSPNASIVPAGVVSLTESPAIEPLSSWEAFVCGQTPVAFGDAAVPQESAAPAAKRACTLTGGVRMSCYS